MKKITKFLMPSVLDLLIGMIFILTLSKIVNYDIWWHLKTGELILNKLAIPKIDPYSFTALGKGWIAHEWLSEVIFYSLYQGFGLNFLIYFKALLIAITFLLLGRLLLREGLNFLSALGLVGLAVIISSSSFILRPHIFSLLFFLLYISKLEELKRLYLLPLVMIVWVNAHGGFVIGLMTLGAYLVATIISWLLYKEKESLLKAKKLAIITLLTTLACLANPWGPKMLIFPFQLVSTSLSHIAEWQSPNFHNHLYYEFGIFLAIGALVLRKGRLHLPYLLLSLLFLHFSLQSVRHLSLFAVSMALFVGSTLKRFTTPRLERMTYFEKLFSSHFLLTLVLIGVGLVYLLPPHNGKGILDLDPGFQAKKYPVKAVEFLREGNLKDERIFSLYHWGGYLIFNLYPKHKVFIDGRIDMYGEKMFEEYQKVYKAHDGWREVLKKYKGKIVLIDRKAPLAAVLKETSDWSEIFSDEDSIIFKLEEK
ncbi:hypothetical protein KJ693_04505 [bacterium]|nr:hypothetical protein [bacterium]MBU1614556.1 hypothetical protein [bacterium]